MRKMRRGMLAATASACLLLAVACSREPRSTAAAGSGTAATIQDIENNPNSYNGKTVTVTGKIADVMGTRSMQLAPESATTGPNILVVSREDWSRVEAGRGEKAVPAPNDVVQVTGKVQMFNRSDIEKDTGTTLTDTQVNQWQGKPVIIARNLTMMSPRTGSTGSMGSEGGTAGSHPTGTETPAQPGR